MDKKPPLDQLEELLDKDWEDDDRISVVVNTAQASPKTSFPPIPSLPTKYRNILLWIMLGASALAGALKVILDTLDGQ